MSLATFTTEKRFYGCSSAYISRWWGVAALLLLIMNIDVPSSSGLGPRSSLPPSSVPLAHNSSTPRSRQTAPADILALDDDDPGADEDDGASSRQRPRARNQRVGDIPIVKDATGEKVLESFEIFLKT